MLVVLFFGLAPILLALVVAAIAAGVVRLREGRRHARILDELGPAIAPAAAARNAVVTVEGELVSLGGSEQIASFHPYGTSFLDEVNVYAVSASSAGKGFAVQLDGGAGRVILDGPTQVLRGTLETEHSTSLDRAAMLGAESLGGAKVKQRVGQFRIVNAGDRVRARGAVEPAPDDDALYRAASNVVRMTPGAGQVGEPTIALAAMTSRRLRTSRRAALPVAVAALLLAGAGAGWASTRVFVPRVAPTVAADAGGPPTCRAPSLEKLSRFEAVTDCDDAYTRALAFYASGDFVHASAAFAESAFEEPRPMPSVAEVETHLFAHAFDRAASVVRRMDEQFYPGPVTAEKQSLACIIEVLDERAKHAEGKIPRFVKVCSLRPFAKVARVLDSNGAYDGEDDWPRPTFFHDARYDAVGETFTSVVAPRARLQARPIALERDLLDRRKTDFGQNFGIYADELNPLLATFAAEVALFYAYAGFPERAAPYWPFLDRIAGMVEKGDTFFQAPSASERWKKDIQDERDLLTITLGVAGAAALYANEPARMKRYTAVGEPYTSDAARQMARITLPGATWEDPVVDRTWPESKAVFDVKGSAAEIAQVLAAQHSTGRTTLPRALPQVRGDRAPLGQWFHSDAYPRACLPCGASTYLGDLSDRREVARLLGETGERERLRASAERFTTALTDPVLGFELDELETFFAKRKSR